MNVFDLVDAAIDLDVHNRASIRQLVLGECLFENCLDTRVNRRIVFYPDTYHLSPPGGGTEK